jgi:argininosuccinate synthase
MLKHPDVKKVVLAYSGGLDTSIILAWLIETYGCEVVAFAADFGQGEDMEAARAKAVATGASAVHIVDVREEFARDYVFTCIKANAVYEGAYLLGTSIARPLIAKAQVEVAKQVGADALSHGATGKGNDQVRFELAYHTLMPGVTVIAPWREWEFKSRTDLVAYAKKHGIPVPVTQARPYSCDRNLMHISYEGGILEDPWVEPPADMFTMTVAPEQAPDKPEHVEIEFVDGTATAVNGLKLSPAALLMELNAVGGRHGVGRVDLVENRYVGIKSRGVYETPGATLLMAAHRGVESLTMDREVMHLRDSLMPKFAELVYYGYWFSPEMELLRGMIEDTQRGVTGLCRLKLYKGNVIMAGRRAQKSLYLPKFATFEKEEVFDQADSTGFIRINAMRLRIQSLVRGGWKT